MSRFPASVWAGEVTGPGLFLGVPEKVYHSDPCPAPSLSSHIAKIALTRSLRHAQQAHPRLAIVEPDLEDEEDDDDAPAPARHLLIGTAAHALMLGAGAPVVEVKVKNFKTKDARETRKAILARGGTPLRTKDFRVASRMAEIARPVFRDLLGGSFIPEAMLAWQEGGVWRRGLVDGCSPDMRIAADYKTCGRPCPPPEAARIASAYDYPFQEGFYRRGFDHLDPGGIGRRKFFFVFQEVEEPHAISIVETDEAHRSMADEKVAGACALWDRALLTNQWPAYPLVPYSASPRPWELHEWEERATTDETLNPMGAVA